MTDPREDAEMEALEAALAEARKAPAEVPGDLMARVLADAARVQAEAARPLARPAPRGLRGLLAALGGWPSVSGLATAAVAGLWIGGYPPEALTGFVETQFGGSMSLGFEAADGWIGEEG